MAEQSSTDLDQVIARAESATAQQAALQTDLVRELHGDLTVTFPVLVSAETGLAGTLVGLAVSGVSPWLTGAGAIAIVLVAAATVGHYHRRSLLLTRAFVSVPEFYVALQRSRRESTIFRERLRLQLDQMLTAIIVLNTARNFADAALKRGGATLEEARIGSITLLQLLVGARFGCFHFKPEDETYNFHLFRWNAATGQLMTFARLKGNLIPDNNRTWAFGQGHVGSCFEARQLLLLDDLQGPAGQGYRKQEKASDKENYRAIIDAPIILTDRPWGVLAITGGTPGQFNESDLVFLSLLMPGFAAVAMSIAAGR